MTAFARGVKGGKCRSMIYFPDDAGYRDTARMLVESGLTLALTEEQELPTGGGVFTPAAGLVSRVHVEMIVLFFCIIHSIKSLQS